MSTKTSTSNAQGTAGALSGSLSTLYERRWLLWYFVHRQISRSYRNSFLGLSWLVLGPLLMVALYTLVFSQILGLRFRQIDSVSNFGLYLYCGLLPFLAFSETLNKSVTSIRSNSSLVKKLVFPLEILPMTAAITAFTTQFFGLGALLLLVAILEHGLQWTLLLIPLIALPQLLFLLGLGYVVSVAGAYLTDLKDGMQALVRALFFVTPILWPADRVSETSPLRPVVDYNPLAFLAESYRNLVLDGSLPDMGKLMWFTIFAAALTVVGLVLFVRAKKQFADLL